MHNVTLIFESCIPTIIACHRDEICYEQDFISTFNTYIKKLRSPN
uniref:Uncharacterized protein n=1 Tax=Arundo donax TaxID=35708 RepID=A0A0A9CD40_ARUDO